LVEAVTQVPKPMVQLVNKEIPKYILQAMELFVDVPGVLNVEVPVEVPEVQVAEAITEVPVPTVQLVEKPIPKVMTEVVEKIQEVPQVLIEEQLVEVPQVQVAEVIRQVQMPVVQTVQRGIPKITTEIREIVQAVPATLVNEVAVDLPQLQTVEVLKQTANCAAQRIVQTQSQWERAAMREEVVERVDASTIGGVYEAGVIGVRENVLVQPTVVERVSPIMTQSIVGGQFMEAVAMEAVAAPTTYVETFGAPTYVETFAAPTTYQNVQQEMLVEVAAPTTYVTYG